MLENDADRLASIKALGGVLVTHEGGRFWAIFDDDFQAAAVGDLAIETLGPTLTCRTSDVRDFAKDYVLTVDGEELRVKRHQPSSPAPGWTLLLLRD
jgi:hypothetical protein